MSENAQTIATLKHGLYYDYKGKVWDNHKSLNADGTFAAQPVTAEEEAYLREYAIHEIEVDGQDYSKCRFEFSNDAPAPRKRVRA
jgi:hypothetical protein